MFHIEKNFCCEKMNNTEITLKIKNFYACCPSTEHIEKIYMMHIEGINL